MRLLPPVFWPASPQWDNYAEVWRTSFYGSWVANSVLIGVLATAGTVLSAAAAGYAAFDRREATKVVLDPWA